LEDAFVFPLQMGHILSAVDNSIAIQVINAPTGYIPNHNQCADRFFCLAARIPKKIGKTQSKMIKEQIIKVMNYPVASRPSNLSNQSSVLHKFSSEVPTMSTKNQTGSEIKKSTNPSYACTNALLFSR
jgi:hypothetical protein